MARYKGAIGNAAPLRIQLSTSASVMARVVEATVQGENTSGSASRPTFSRPSTPGSGSGTVQSIDGFGTASSFIITAFTVSPSLPGVTSGGFDLPFAVHWAVPRESAFIVPPSAHFLLYADATGGHLWSGELVFEEG